MVLEVRIITELNMNTKSDISAGFVIDNTACGFSDLRLIKKPIA
jgi:hypothetical protein